VVVAGLVGGEARAERLADGGLLAEGWYAVLQSGGLLFFAFAGYARLATMGEEVRDPRRTIPRVISLALALALALLVYVAVATTLLTVLGPGGVASSTAPLAAAVEAGSWAWATRGRRRRGAAPRAAPTGATHGRCRCWALRCACSWS
jgi:APA family basic amino acid/polyamine antiporter